MARLGLGRIAAGGLLLAGLQLLFMGPVSGAERTVRAEIYAAPTPTLALGASTMAFGLIALGNSVDSTDGTAATSTTSTNNSIVMTNDSGVNGPTGRITSLTLDYTDATPGAKCPTSEGDWVPDSTNLEANIGADEFVMYGDIINDLTTKIVIPANGNASVSLTVGTWAKNNTLDLDLQLFMPATITTGSVACSIAITLTAVVG